MSPAAASSVAPTAPAAAAGLTELLAARVGDPARVRTDLPRRVAAVHGASPYLFTPQALNLTGCRRRKPCAVRRANNRLRKTLGRQSPPKTLPSPWHHEPATSRRLCQSAVFGILTCGVQVAKSTPQLADIRG
ncbi:hypothetical protein ACWD5V_20550 [Streptomyces sp. NPDC002523]